MVCIVTTSNYVVASHSTRETKKETKKKKKRNWMMIGERRNQDPVYTLLSLGVGLLWARKTEWSETRQMPFLWLPIT
jgi:hypothetical protein